MYDLRKHLTKSYVTINLSRSVQVEFAKVKPFRSQFSLPVRRANLVGWQLAESQVHGELLTTAIDRYCHTLTRLMPE
jgi:hypothetical protein